MTIPRSHNAPDAIARRLTSLATPRSVPKSTVLCRAGDKADQLLLILSGVVESVPAGEVYASTIISGAAPSGTYATTLRARTDVQYATIPADALDAEGIGGPELEAVAASVIQSLQHRELVARASSVFGPLDDEAVRQLEAESRWVSLRRGDILVRQGDAGDSMFVLLAGRLQALAEHPDGTVTPVGETASGETVGEMAFFTGEPRSATVCAVRDSLLIELQRPAVERLIASRPETLRQVIRVQIDRVRRANAHQTKTARITNIAVVPLDRGVPAGDFCRRLEAALAKLGSVVHLDSATVDQRLHCPGIADASYGSPLEPHLVAWLGEQERTSRFVVYETNETDVGWLARAIRQADCVLLVGRATGSPERTAFERRAADEEHADAPVRRILVLIHDDDTLPRDTEAWLRARPVAQHHHVRWNRDGDMDRLSRFLADRAVGVVLGGGGARGFAHIGVLRALEEAGIPIDLLGGTSMGSAMAAQHAMGWTPARIAETNDTIWNRIRPHREFTLPLLSLVRADGALRCGMMMYGTTRIEDLWIPYFCVSSDLTDASMRVHRSGSLLLAVTASSSMPGVIVPTVLDDHLLCDGALFNNLPGDVARVLGCGPLIASRVSLQQDKEFIYERVPSLGDVVRHKITRRPVRYPGLVSVLVRSSMLASIHRENTVAQNADLLFEPPLEHFGLMEFTALAPIVEAGYRHAVERIAEWERAGRLAQIPHAAASS